MIHDFTSDLRRSLTPARMTTGVQLLEVAFPHHRWVGSVTASDVAGVDVFGYLPGGNQPPITVDFKFRDKPLAAVPRIVMELGTHYQDGHTVIAPLMRNQPPAAAWYLYVHDARGQAPVAFLVDTAKASGWLKANYQDCPIYQNQSVGSGGVLWENDYALVRVDTLEEEAPDAIRLVTLAGY